MEDLNKTNTPNILDFGEPHKENCIIKVIGVGGGGGNAVNHMYREGIHDVSFVLCNTDNQALNDSPVPVHLQLGKEGLGAGNKPEKARQAAEESLESVRKMLNDGTKMTFITAGMGGGTGTGKQPAAQTTAHPAANAEDEEEEKAPEPHKPTKFSRFFGSLKKFGSSIFEPDVNE